MFDVPQTSVEICKHLQIDISKAVEFLADTKRWMLKIKVQCQNPKCRTPFIFQGLPAGLNLEGATTNITGVIGQFAILPEGERPIPRPNAPTGFSFPPPGGPA